MKKSLFWCIFNGRIQFFWGLCISLDQNEFVWNLHNCKVEWHLLNVWQITDDVRGWKSLIFLESWCHVSILKIGQLNDIQTFTRNVSRSGIIGANNLTFSLSDLRGGHFPESDIWRWGPAHRVPEAEWAVRCRPAADRRDWARRQGPVAARPDPVLLQALCDW